jgi:hypothetical protein
MVCHTCISLREDNVKRKKIASESRKKLSESINDEVMLELLEHNIDINTTRARTIKCTRESPNNFKTTSLP